MKQAHQQCTFYITDRLFKYVLKIIFTLENNFEHILSIT